MKPSSRMAATTCQSFLGKIWGRFGEVAVHKDAHERAEVSNRHARKCLTALLKRSSAVLTRVQCAGPVYRLVNCGSPLQIRVPAPVGSMV
jgi:histidinol dehydrogenase